MKNCNICNTEMLRLKASESFELGRFQNRQPDLYYPLSDHPIYAEIYMCPKCGQIQFFAPEEHITDILQYHNIS